MTLQVLGNSGIRVVNENYSLFRIEGNQAYDSGIL